MTEASLQPHTPSSLRVAGISVAVILLSFAFGVGMFLPAEHRAEKWAETLERYEARKDSRAATRSRSTKRIMLPSAFESLPVLDTLGGDFSLASTRGKPLGPADFRGAPLLVNFGFTACPDVCPTTLRRMRDVLTAFPDKEINALFVTIDPERDTLDRLSRYLEAFDSRFVGLTGSLQEIADVSNLYRVYQASDEAEGIVHSNEIYLLDADGRTRATFNSNFRVSEMIETVERLL